MTVASDSWRRIRRLRAQPPLLAGAEIDPARTRVFQAALTQAEELWEASAAVSAASRPLPLFYCLSQAGRAICAAWTTTGPWEATGHGLSSRDQFANFAVPVFRVRVTGGASGMFKIVASTTDSSLFEGAVTVAALWASLPDLPPARDVTGDERRPVYVERAILRGEAADLLSALAPKVARLSYPRPARFRSAAWRRRR
jgi:YaaC-like protein